jgi:ribonuclease Z
MLKPVIAGAQTRKLSRLVKLLTDIQEYHMEPVVAAELAKEADVKKIVYVHIVPPLPNKLAEKTYLKGVSDVFNGEIVLGEDNMKFRLDPKQ